MARISIETCFVALVVVRLGHRFLLVQELGNRWYLPAGGVESGETLFDAAYRETMEEAGIPIVLEGILRVEHTPIPDGSARVRIFFLARPLDDTPPKRKPDEESLGASWRSLKEIEALPLRGIEVLQIFRYVENGGTVFPLSLLKSEGNGWSV